MNHKKTNIDTQLIHTSTKAINEQKTGAVNVPLYLSSTFHQESFESFGSFGYTRISNPTRQALEQTIALLEGGQNGFAFPSGMAAISTAFMLLSADDHVIVSEDVYGGTYQFVTEVLTKLKIAHTFVDMTHTQSIKDALQTNTKVIYMETPSNPCLEITDIKAVVQIAKENNCLTFIDNTFMSPLFQRPIELGVDVVLHSATKFLSGHSDIIAGLAVTKDEKLGNELAFLQKTFGSILGVQDCFTLIQGIKTLGVRLKQSSDTALKIAQHLSTHKHVEKVYYPGLVDHDGHDLHKQQASGAGAVLSFRLPNRDVAKSFIEHINISIFAMSLGGGESILSYPSTMSHGDMPRTEREARGITDGLLRLSVGLEDANDLIADIDQALSLTDQSDILD